jgi:hypothetical protein
VRADEFKRLAKVRSLNHQGRRYDPNRCPKAEGRLDGRIPSGAGMTSGERIRHFELCKQQTYQTEILSVPDGFSGMAGNAPNDAVSGFLTD